MTETAYERITAALRAHGCKVVERSGQRASATCPAHEDRNPSLSVDGGPDRVLVKCQAGCDTDAVLSALDMSAADLFDTPKTSSGGRDDWTPCGHGIAAEYRYVDESGELLFTVVRCPEKDFVQWRPDPTAKSGRRWKLGDTRRVLYRLPRVLEAAAAGATVYVVEGEKDVHAVEAAGGIATCNPMGAGKWRPEYADALKGAAVVVVADRDDKGRAHAAQVAASLAGVAESVTVVEAAAGKDPADHLAAGYTVDDFVTVDPGQFTPEGVATDPPAPATETAPERPPALRFMTVRELRAKVAAAGPRRWLLRGIWPAGDYGVLAGDAKAQKSWTATDAAVSVASGTPWLGRVPVDLTGPVVMFVGEGGEADTLRRIDAVCAARGINADDLPITVCCRAPHLSDRVHLGLMADQLDQSRPVFTSLDPFYLAAGGAKGSDLYAMGQLLERPQHMCQEIGSALLITTHQNRKEGRGASRISGAGPAEWGRVLISATVKSRHRDKATTETTVITELDVVGGSIPGGRLRVVRRIVADDPDDLDSPLHYHVECEDVDDGDDDGGKPAGLPPAAQKILTVLSEGTLPLSNKDIGDAVKAKFGHGLTRPTISKMCAALVADGLADEITSGGPNGAKFWTVTAHE